MGCKDQVGGYLYALGNRNNLLPSTTAISDCITNTQAEMGLNALYTDAKGGIQIKVLTATQVKAITQARFTMSPVALKSASIRVTANACVRYPPEFK